VCGQWDESDLTFGKEKTMIGSNGKIIKLDEKDRAGPPKQLKSQLLTTSTKSRRFVLWLLLSLACACVCARASWRMPM